MKQEDLRMNELNQLNNKEKVNLIPFSECFKIYQTNSLSRDKLTYDVGDIKNIHYGDIHKFLPVITNVSTENLPYIKSDINTSKIKQESYCRNGDVIMADTAEDYAGVGKAIEVTGIENQKVIGGLHTYLCRDEKHVFVDGFRGYILNSPFVHNQIMKYSAGMKVYSITKTNLSKILIPCPPITEQKRIASILSTLDKAIEQANLAIEEGERMKRGLIQKIIPDNIENMDGWKIIQLSELGIVQTGPFGSQLHNKDYVKNGHPIITVEHLSEYGIMKENLPCVSDFDKERLSKFVLHIGDIVFSRVGSVDRNCIVTQAEEGWLFSGRLLRIRPNSTIVNPKYLSFFFQTHKFKVMINNHSVGGIMPSLNTKLMNEVLVTLPPLEEQEKIVKIIDCANDRITSSIHRKSLLETLKRGMMQQLLSGVDIS